MDKIRIIQVSDIHFEHNRPENNKLVLEAFFTDLKHEIEHRNDTYCIISGDLTNKGSSKEYNDFYDYFIFKMMKIIPLKNIICVPGNHDLNRNIIEKNLKQHQEIISKGYSESDFNDFITDGTSNIIHEKFENYSNFCINKLQKSNFNYYGYPELLVPEISVFCLNIAS